MNLIRTTSENVDFTNLVKSLDQDLAIINGDKNDFFVQFNKLDLIQHVVVAYDSEQAIACGAMKEYDKETMEVKRMFVLPHMRGNGIAALVLNNLEEWANELGYKRCILETGEKMKEAIVLYKKCNYNRIENYEPYKDVIESRCFEKKLK